MIDTTKFDGHTPGPWKRGGLERIYDSQIREICDVRGWGWLQYLPGGAQQQDANMALIEAAPDLLAEVIRLRAALEAITEQRDCALSMLAGWCVDVYRDGTVWGDWGESCKDAMYRPGPLRKELDAAIAKENANRGGGCGIIPPDGQAPA